MKIGRPELVVCEAGARDAKNLPRLAARPFRQTYRDRMPAGDLWIYSADDFDPRQQHRELPDHRVTTLLVRIDRGLGGFAQPGRKPLPVEGDLDIGLELWKIYLDRGLQGAGFGRRQPAAVGEAALGFYRRNGFETVDSQPSEIGGEVHADIVTLADTDRL